MLSRDWVETSIELDYLKQCLLNSAVGKESLLEKLKKLGYKENALRILSISTIEYIKEYYSSFEKLHDIFSSSIVFNFLFLNCTKKLDIEYLINNSDVLIKLGKRLKEPDKLLKLSFSSLSLMVQNNELVDHVCAKDNNVDFSAIYSHAKKSYQQLRDFFIKNSDNQEIIELEKNSCKKEETHIKLYLGIYCNHK